MFDLTKEIKIEKTLHKKYLILRAFLHIFFGIACCFVIYTILFPTISLDFLFDSPTSQKNSLSQPRIESADGTQQTDGKITANDKLIINANPLGQFSKAKITFTLDNSKSDISNTLVQIKKSYQAFRYPEGTPFGFKNGTLLTTPSGAYYIISNGQLRKFANTDIILKLGYPKNAFLKVSEKDLAYNEVGDEITNADVYPENSLFAINDTYYQLKNNQLFPYVSTRAFLSQFEANNAIVKDESFLASNQIAETQLGFADGTLVSSDTSVYILSEDKSYPVMNPETFLAMGFNWDDVIPVSQDELNVYNKQKQFTYRMPHPNGTIFVDKISKKYFVVDNGSKRPVLSEAIAATFAKQKPIVVDIQGVELSDSCSLKKPLFDSNTFQCNTSLENLVNLVGGNYEITSTFSNKANLDTVNIKFSTPFNWQNMRISLGAIKNKILAKWQK